MVIQDPPTDGPLIDPHIDTVDLIKLVEHSAVVAAVGQTMLNSRLYRGARIAVEALDDAGMLPAEER